MQTRFRISSLRHREPRRRRPGRRSNARRLDLSPGKCRNIRLPGLRRNHQDPPRHNRITGPRGLMGLIGGEKWIRSLGLYKEKMVNEFIRAKTVDLPGNTEQTVGFGVAFS